MFTGKISFCTSVMNRLKHINQTLPANLRNSDENTEFVILNYSDKQGLHEWMLSNGYINHPRIVYCRQDNEEFYKPAHAKNLAHKYATADYQVTLDADNFLGPNAIKTLREAIAQKAFVNCKGLYGFLGMYKTDFYAIGGYNEEFKHWGFNDDDMRSRCKHSGMSKIVIEPEGTRTISHSNAERIANTGQKSMVESLMLQKKQSAENIKNGKLIANRS